MISFTGSTAVGRAAVAASAATLKKVSMELGGKNPQVIFPDADMDAALDAAAFGAYSTQANAAMRARASCLHASIAEDFLAGPRRSGGARPRSAIRLIRRPGSGRSSAPIISARSRPT